jgi:hypothetical protein
VVKTSAFTPIYLFSTLLVFKFNSMSQPFAPLSCFSTCSFMALSVSSVAIYDLIMSIHFVPASVPTHQFCIICQTNHPRHLTYSAVLRCCRRQNCAEKVVVMCHECYFDKFEAFEMSEPQPHNTELFTFGSIMNSLVTEVWFSSHQHTQSFLAITKHHRQQCMFACAWHVPNRWPQWLLVCMLNPATKGGKL